MNKKLILFFLIVASINFSSLAQVPSISWQKCYGGIDPDELHDLKKTSDGGYIFAGDVTSVNGDVSGNHGSYDGWITKINSLGTLQWQKCIGGTGADHINSINPTTDGGFIVSGYTYSNDGDVSGNHGNGDYWVVKLNNIGTIQWQKCFGGSGFDMSNSVIQTNDGGYLIGGVSRSIDGDVIGNRGSDIWLIKLNNVGTIQWQNCYGGSGDEIPESISQTTDGGYIIFSQTQSNDGDVSGNHGNYDYWVIKINNTGIIQWQKCYGGINAETSTKILQTIDGGYILSGLSSSNDGDVSGNHGNNDAWIVKINSVGIIEWQKCFGGSSSDLVNSIIQTSDGNYVFAGVSSSNDGDVYGNYGNGNAWIFKINNTGILLWQKCIGGSNGAQIQTIEKTTDGGYLLGGYTASNDGNVSGNHGNNDCWVVKLSNSTTCTQPNLTLSSPGCIGTPITLTSDTGIAQVQWYLNGNLISTQQGWKINGVTVAGGNGAGSALNQLNKPIGLFVDSTENLFIAENANSRIVKWPYGAISGQIVAGLAGVGTANNQLNTPTDVVIDKSGFMYIADYQNQRIVKWRLGATSGSTIAGGNGFGTGTTQFYNPMGLDVDTLGNVYVCDAGNHRIQRFPQGSNSSTAGTTIAGGYGAGAGSYQLSNPFDVFIDDSLNVFVSDWGNGRVQKFLRGSSYATTIGSGMTYPSGVFVDKKGNVYGSDQNNHRIIMWPANSTIGVVIAGGNGLGSASNQLAYPQKIFLDKVGNLFVADGNNYRVQKFTLNNSFTFTPTQSGTYTAIVTTFNGCTFSSNSILINNTNLLSDSTKVCGDTTALISVGNGYSSYRWSTGDTTSSISVSQNGIYKVTVTTPSGCTISDSSFVSIINAKIINNDTTICGGDSVRISTNIIKNSFKIGDSYGGGKIAYILQAGDFGYTAGLIKGLVATNSDLTSLPWGRSGLALGTSSGIGYGNSNTNIIVQNTSGLNNAAGVCFDLNQNGLSDWFLPSKDELNKLYLKKTIIGGFASLKYWSSTESTSGAFYAWSQNFSSGIQEEIYNRSVSMQVRPVRNFSASVYTFRWSTGDTTLSINVAPTQTTTYYCTISNGITSCVDSVTITVGINPFQDTTKICGDSTILDAGAGYTHYSWSTGDSTRTIVVKNNGNYKVTVTNSNGCSSSDSTYVSLLSAKILQKDTTICKGTSLTLTLNLQPDSSSYLSDIDGNIYPVISIGNQIWLQKNLNVSRYRNGDTIPQVTDPIQWSNLTTGAWCWYNNDSATYASTYGKLYNWYAVNDIRGLVPNEYRIPTFYDWTKMIKYLDSNADTSISMTQQSQVVGGYLKEVGTQHWNSPNYGANNITGFTALPGGVRLDNGIFGGVGVNGQWWSSTEFISPYPKNCILYSASSIIDNGGNHERHGFSIRGVKNKVNYLWSTGDTTISAIVSPRQTTSYYVNVSNGINSCVDSVKITIPVLDTSINVLDTSATICSNNGSVKLQAGIATSYQWLFNGSPIPNATSRIDTARQSGSYRVIVTNNLGCKDTSRAIQVNIYSLPTIPTISASGSTTFCSNSSLTLNATAVSGTLQWYYNGSALPGANTSSLSVNQSGQYSVSVTNSNACTSSSSNITISTITAVTPTFVQVVAICRSGSFSLPTTSTNGITGTWSPAINNLTTTTYTFTPSSGQCANTTTMTVTVNQPVTPTFTQVTAICRGGSFTLPTTSTNGVSGTWSPAINNLTTTTYTFTPSSGQCANTTTMTVTVNQPVTPTFTQVAAICRGASFTLPTTSTNGITGTWSPAINNLITTTYSFTPSSGQCANTTTMTVTVNQPVTPTFTQVAAICRGGSFSLPTTSTNGITGTWSPAINNLSTTTYSFTPSSGQCANTTTMTVTVNQPVTPTFTQVAAICRGASFFLPTTSTNGITGAWSPAINNLTTTTYTFTPTTGQCANTTTMTVTVNQPVTPTFNQVAAVCRGTSFTLPTTSTNGITGAWSPAINNLTTTTYTFTPTTGQCANTTTMTVTINQPVTPTFNQVAAICRGGSFSLPTTSTNGITGAWSPAINNLTTTTYTFTPTTGQCANTTTMTVTVTQPVAPTFTQIASICRGGLFTLPTTSINGIRGTWSPAINNLTTTTYTFTPTTGQCANTTTMTVTVNQPVTPTFNQVAAVCRGTSFTLPTTSTNGITGTWSPAINNLTTTTYTFTPTTGQCVTTTVVTMTVVVNTLPTGSISPISGNICEGSSLTLTAIGGISYQWYNNGILNTSTNSQNLFATQAGTYTVKIYASNGCSAMASNSSTLTLTKRPVADFDFNTHCIKTPISFINTSTVANSLPVTYSWSFGNGSTSTSQSPTQTYYQAGNYNVTLSVRSNVCPNLQSIKTKIVSIDTLIKNQRYPTVNALVYNNTPLNARLFNSASYSWLPTTGLTGYYTSNPVYNSNSQQEYKINITTDAGCLVTDTLKVNIFATQDIFVPKGFSPNNDGNNDYLFPILVGLKSFNYFQVYNRWGQKVFETTSETQGWDGKYRGVNQPIETYTWIAEGIGLDGNVVKKSGGTLLMR